MLPVIFHPDAYTGACAGTGMVRRTGRRAGPDVLLGDRIRHSHHPGFSRYLAEVYGRRQAFPRASVPVCDHLPPSRSRYPGDRSYALETPSRLLDAEEILAFSASSLFLLPRQAGPRAIRHPRQPLAHYIRRTRQRPAGVGLWLPFWPGNVLARKIMRGGLCTIESA